MSKQPNRSPLSAMSDDEFIRRYPVEGAVEIARMCGVSERTVHTRRRKVENEHGIRLSAKHLRGGDSARGRQATLETHRHLLQSTGFEAKEIKNYTIKDGTVIVSSDHHYWPGMISTAHFGLVKMIEELKPTLTVLNGDVLDGARISRWPPPGWEHQPELLDEMDAVLERTEEVYWANPEGDHEWTWGNHCARFALKIASNLPELRGIKGMRLHDHYDRWGRSWGILVNETKAKVPTLIKHRFKGGQGATRNNVIHAGCNVVTGHLHSAKVTPFTNFMHTLWGVDSGCVAEPKGRQFTSYTEANPTDWRSGFAVLTFKNYELMQPELCLTVEKGVMQFRGEYLKV